jgi:hypothetical protein
MSQNKDAQLIDNIRNGKFTERELINLYKNATTQNATAIMDAVKIKMRADFPRAANRMFGAKQNKATAILEDVINKLSTTYNFNANRVRNGVKAGGEMISGKKHIDVYISYKNDNGFATSLGLIQDDLESELIAKVDYYKTGNDSFREEQVFKMHDFDHAVHAYKAQLSKVFLQEQHS